MARGRPRKNSNLISIDTSPEKESDQPIGAEAKIKKKSVTKVERWTEDAPSVAQLEIPMEEEFDYAEPRDPFDIVVADFGGDTDAGYIKVFRLPEYAKKGIASPKNALREFCDNIPATPDYLSIIKDQWGPGTYYLDLRDGDGGFRKGKTVTIAAPAFPVVRPYSSVGHGAGAQNPTTMHLTQAPGIPVEPPDPIKQFDQMIDMVSKFRKAFGLPLEQQPQVQVQPPKEEDGEESFVKSMMTIAMADDNLRSSAIKSVSGLLKGNGGAHETSVNDLILAGINVLPAIFDKAEGFLSRILTAKGVQLPPAAAAPAASLVQTQVHNPASPSSLVTTPPSNPDPAPGSSTEEQVIQRALQTLLITCSEHPLHVKNCEYPECGEAKHMMGVANWILDYETTYPEIIGPLINDLMKLSPDQVLETIKLSPETAQYASLPHCRQWIEDLQEALRKASEPEGDQSS